MEIVIVMMEPRKEALALYMYANPDLCDLPSSKDGRTTVGFVIP
jgi:hypothetical protein